MSPPRPCHFFARGECTRGSTCPFSHDTREAQVMGLPCKYFVAGGLCKYGDSCRFDHPARVGAGGGDGASSSSSVPRAAPEPALPSAGDLFAAHDDLEEAKEARPPPSSWAGIFVPPDAALAAWEAAEAAEAQAADDEAAAAAAASFGGLTIIDDDEDRFHNAGTFFPSSSSFLPADPAAATAAAAAGEGSGAAASSSSSSPSSDGGLCGQWAASGTCSRGDRCHLPHGEPCQSCGRNALHPSDPALRAAHAAECRARAARVAELQASLSVECAICLEKVLSKEGCRPSDRRFGLLEGCAHAFCLPCIRSWRGQAASQQAAAPSGPQQQQQQQQQQPRNQIDVATSLRTCPLCRTPAWFVTPSATWPRDDGARREIVDAYRRSLARIECRWWDRGRGSCPFGTSCFYLHLDADGREVARGEGLRFVGDGEGVVKPISQGAKLSDFIEFAVVKRGGNSSGGGRRGGGGGGGGRR